jgi:hypothetical protein
MEWFQARGIQSGSPEQIIADFEDGHKRKIALAEHHPAACPTLSRRVKTLSSLHIDLDFHTRPGPCALP